MVTMKFDDHGLAISLAHAKDATGLQLQKWMTLVMAHLHAAVNRNIAKGGLIGRRTGNLARSMRDLVTVTPTGVIGTFWPDPDKAIYGDIQEEGGTVLPKRGRFLAIPLDAMLTGNGVARGTAGQVRDNPTGFGFSGTFVHAGVIFGKQAKSVIPLFALKPSVVIPAHHYLRITLVQEWQWMADLLEQLTGDTVHVLFGEGAFPA